MKNGGIFNAETSLARSYTALKAVLDVLFQHSLNKIICEIRAESDDFSLVRKRNFLFHICEKSTTFRTSNTKY